MACCGCFKPFKPRYKRHVDSIFPPNPDDGIVMSNMEKLTFYALSAPEKLDRIGHYLAQRLSRDIQRHRTGYVYVAMQALDELLKACHAPSLNLFVESFLTMVQLLLESSQPGLQQLATRSFMTFANIEEDTPSYHRRYDFFISKFSSMCFDQRDDDRLKSLQRLSGLRGLQGVIRKTVADDSQKNIWEPTHMNKIVPALLINMQTSTVGGASAVSAGASLDDEEDNPSKLGEVCLRDLVGRAGFGQMKSVLRPMFRFLDDQQAWEPNDFAKFTMHTVMFSVQSQYSYLVVLSLLEHLDTIDSSNANSLTIRTSVVQVLGATISLADGGSLGPSHLDVFNTLLRQLRLSIDIAEKNTSAIGAGPLQEAVIETVGAFSTVLPSYAQSDVMKFIVGKLPPPGQAEGAVEGVTPGDASISRFTSVYAFNMFREMLVQCISKVVGAYNPTKISPALAPSFFEPLLKHCLVAKKEVRLAALRIMHRLIDISGNVSHIPRTTSYSSLSTIQQGHVARAKDADVLREDELYFKRHGAALLQQVYDHAVLSDNDTEIYVAVFQVLCLLCTELGASSSLVDLARMALALQDFAIEANSSEFGPKRISSLHCVVGMFMRFGSLASENSTFVDCVDKVLRARAADAPYLLPATCFSASYAWGKNTSPVGSSPLLFQHDLISSALAADLTSKYTRVEPSSAVSGPLPTPTADAASIVNVPTMAAEKKNNETVTVSSLVMKWGSDTPETSVLPSFGTFTEESLRRNADAQTKFQELLDHVSQQSVSHTLTVASALALPTDLPVPEKQVAYATPWKFNTSHEDLRVF